MKNQHFYDLSKPSSHNNSSDYKASSSSFNDQQMPTQEARKYSKEQMIQLPSSMPFSNQKPPVNSSKSLAFLTSKKNETPTIINQQFRLNRPQSFNQLNKIPQINNQTPNLHEREKQSSERNRSQEKQRVNHLSSLSKTEEFSNEKQEEESKKLSQDRFSRMPIPREESASTRALRLTGKKKKECDEQKVLLRERAGIIREQIKESKEEILRDETDENRLKNSLETLMISARIESVYPEEMLFLLKQVQQLSFFDWKSYSNELKQQIISISSNKKIRQFLTNVKQHQYSLKQILDELLDELIQQHENHQQHMSEFAEKMERQNEESIQKQQEINRLNKVIEEKEDEREQEDVKRKQSGLITKVELDKEVEVWKVKVNRIQLISKDFEEENKILKAQIQAKDNQIKELIIQKERASIQNHQIQDILHDFEGEIENRKKRGKQQKDNLKQDLQAFQGKLQEYCIKINEQIGKENEEKEQNLKKRQSVKETYNQNTMQNSEFEQASKMDYQPEKKERHESERSDITWEEDIQNIDQNKQIENIYLTSTFKNINQKQPFKCPEWLQN